MLKVIVISPSDIDSPFRDSIRGLLSQMATLALKVGVSMDQAASCKELPLDHLELVFREDLEAYFEKAKGSSKDIVSQVHFVSVQDPAQAEPAKLAILMYPQVSVTVPSFQVLKGEEARKPNSMKSPIDMPRPEGTVKVPSLKSKTEPLFVPADLLRGAKIVVLDAEIKKAIHWFKPKGEDDKDPGPLPFMDYCQGFDDFENMGLATVGTYDFEECREHIFWDDTYDLLIQQLESAELVVGFNNIPFDSHLLKAAGIEVPFDKQYDLLLDIWTSLGFGLDYNKDTHGGFNLNAMVSANSDGILGKNDNGALAPFYYQTGKNGRLSRYQMGDTYITAFLFNQAVKNGCALKHPTSGEWIKLVDLSRIIYQ